MMYKIAIIGLGYVGLPLAVAFGKYFKTIGFDINKKRISSLKKNIDLNKEVDVEDFKKSTYINFTYSLNKIKESNIYIISVPTPIYKNKNPDLRILINSCKNVAKYLSKGNIVIFESTVYPGLTENICIPILEKISKLLINKDFFVGYSPERINPGDKKRKLENITKVISASNKSSLIVIDYLYSKIIKAGTFKASSIKVAEAAKVIENTQRDINIAFMNELSMLFNKLEINTEEVLEVASTKWNFLNFKPGFVGGHCIGVDPYYLKFIAKKNNFNTKIISSGREINDGMPKYFVDKINYDLQKNNIKSKLKILIMGYTFKENCNDIRNSQIINISNQLKKKKHKIDIYDPWIYNLRNSFDENVIKYPKNKYYDIVIISVAHNIFKDIGLTQILKFKKNKKSFLYDLKSLFKKQKNNFSL